MSVNIQQSTVHTRVFYSELYAAVPLTR